MQGGEKGKEGNLGLGSAISGKNRAGCRASDGEGGGRHSRILGLPLSESCPVQSSLPCPVSLFLSAQTACSIGQDQVSATQGTKGP